jgi:hypothetical protein
MLVASSLATTGSVIPAVKTRNRRIADFARRRRVFIMHTFMV